MPECKWINRDDIVIPRELFEELVEDAIELRGEWKWKAEEVRGGYQREYNDLQERIRRAVELRDGKCKTDR